MAENHAGIRIRPVCTGDAECLCSIMNCPFVLQALNEVPTGQQDWTDAIQMRREKRLPFEVSIDPFYSDLNISHLRRVIAEVDSGLAKLEEHPLKEE